MTRILKRRGSSAWPVAKATVTSSACPKAMYGCDVAGVCYTYRVDGELYTGINEKPFISHSSGRPTLVVSHRERNFARVYSRYICLYQLCARGLRMYNLC